MTKSDLELEVKALRFQMASMKKQMQDREDKLFAVFQAIEPFFPVLLAKEEDKAKFYKELGISND